MGISADVLATGISLLGIGIVVVVIVDVRNTRPRHRKRVSDIHLRDEIRVISIPPLQCVRLAQVGGPPKWVIRRAFSDQRSRSTLNVGHGEQTVVRGNIPDCGPLHGVRRESKVPGHLRLGPRGEVRAILGSSGISGQDSQGIDFARAGAGIRNREWARREGLSFSRSPSRFP